jgi:hypothetical protein
VGTFGTITLQSGAFASTGVYAVALQTKWNPSGGTGEVQCFMKSDGTRTLSCQALGLHAYEPLDPRSIANLACWFAADRITGVSNGASLGTWSDLSGNGNDAIQSGAPKPSYQTNVISGKPVVRFDGSNDYLKAASSSSLKPTAVTMFVVGSLSGTGVHLPFMTFRDTVPSHRWAMTVDGGGSPQIRTIFNGTSYSAAATVTRFVSWACRSTDNIIYGDNKLVVNSADIATITYGTGDGLYIGTSNAGDFLQGDIAEIIVYGRALTDNEYGDVQLYLREKYGLLETTAM